MIVCENEDCSIEWFHTDCLRIECAKGEMVLPRLPQTSKFKTKKGLCISRPLK